MVPCSRNALVAAAECTPPPVWILSALMRRPMPTSAPPRSVAGAAVLYRQQPPICKGCRSGFRPVSEITTEADGLSETGPGAVVLPIRCPARLPGRGRPERPADPSAPETLPRCRRQRGFLFSATPTTSPPTLQTRDLAMPILIERMSA
jgi:hypothetical protein